MKVNHPLMFAVKALQDVLMELEEQYKDPEMDYQCLLALTLLRPSVMEEIKKQANEVILSILNEDSGKSV